MNVVGKKLHSLELSNCHAKETLPFYVGLLNKSYNVSANLYVLWAFKLAL